jgi:hypothetical protein
MKKILSIVPILFCILLFTTCKKNSTEDSPQANLIFKFKFDSTQQRLDGFGNPAADPASLGHGAQSPVFNKMSSHYIELTPSSTTALGSGTVVFKNAETTEGGATAIDFSKSTLAGQGETFFSIPLSQVKTGSYNYLRVSLAYQNYTIKYRFNYLGTDYDATGTLASFIGYNTYIKNYIVKDSTVTLNANRLQGYWGFEWCSYGIAACGVSTGQAPPGATTVPNPIFSSSPIPQGSCVVTGKFATSLTITGNETSDIVITVSLSVNKSFEWAEHSTAGYFEPLAGDSVVDMGVRGLVPIVN